MANTVQLLTRIQKGSNSSPWSELGESVRIESSSKKYFAEEPRIFLSHNYLDKDFVTKLAAALTLAGAQVWYDSWQIRPGDSIPSAIENGLKGFDTFALIWSENAANSNWVHAEREAALIRWVNEKQTYRFIPIRLDATPVPMLIASLMYINASDRDHLKVTQEILGISSEVEFRQAIQDFVDNSGIEFREFHGAGVFACCPKCGAPASDLQGWQDTDDKRGDLYAGVMCTKCNWSDGGEV